MEIERNLTGEEVPRIAIQVEEVQKLNQFQLQTGMETVIAFPLDVHGTAWKRLDPAGLSLTAQLMSFKVKNSTLLTLGQLRKLPSLFN